MKTLLPHTINPLVARKQWHELRSLLSSKPTLDEQKDVLPFFASRRDLSMLITYYYPDIRQPDVIAHEFPIGGDFKADLVVGDSSTREYLLVEFENASSTSVFSGRKAKRDWAKRFEGAFSQLVDWLWKLEDMRSTADFSHTFGSREASFHGLIIIGKDLNFSASEKARLRWRTDHTLVDSKRIAVRSFDQLLDDADFRLRTYMQV